MSAARKICVYVLQLQVDKTEWKGENVAEQVHGGGNNLVITWEIRSEFDYQRGTKPLNSFRANQNRTSLSTDPDFVSLFHASSVSKASAMYIQVILCFTILYCKIRLYYIMQRMVLHNSKQVIPKIHRIKERSHSVFCNHQTLHDHTENVLCKAMLYLFFFVSFK